MATINGAFSMHPLLAIHDQVDQTLFHMAVPSVKQAVLPAAFIISQLLLYCLFDTKRGETPAT
jgi:hypothetical protein